jgi:hypothetical protein
MLALLEETSVVDDPALHRTVQHHGLQRVVGRGTPDVAIRPSRVGDEVQQALTRCIGGSLVTTTATGDRFHALAVAVAEDPHGVDGEGLAPTARAQHVADLLEVQLESLRCLRVHSHRHEGVIDHAQIAKSTTFLEKFITHRNDPAFRNGPSAPAVTQQY